MPASRQDRRPVRSRVRRGALAVIAGLVVLPMASATGSSTASPLTADGGRPFADSSAWNQPVPAGHAVDPGSAAMVARLASGHQVADLYEFGVPVFVATDATPRYRVDCLQDWGVCELEDRAVPIPQEARPSSGSDGAMVVVDLATRTSYEFWQYRFNAGRPTVSWGDTSNVDGDGRDSTAVGAGVSRLAGVVRTHEVRRGVIDHALVFSTSWCQQGTFRSPATKTDGKYSGTGAVPEGARVQLDPTLDVDAIAGITPVERMVAKALQVYGAYNIDCGGASMALIFEAPHGEADPYPGAGLADYSSFPHIPWHRLRVLSATPSASPSPSPSASPSPSPSHTAVPAALTAPSALRSTGVGTHSVGLAWKQAAGPVSGYQVWRGDAAWSHWSLVKTLPAGSGAVTVRGLPAGRTLTFAVRAVDARGRSSASSNAIRVRTRTG